MDGSPAPGTLGRAIAGLVITLMACRQSDRQGDTAAASGIDWTGRVTLEETATVVNVWPVVRRDPRGGVLVADIQEGQFRRYDRTGHLIAHFGSKGDGPSQFQRPTVAVRLLDGRILVAERNRGIVILDSTGTSVSLRLNPVVRGIDDADVINDSTILLSGLAHDHPDSPRLHLWDPRTNTVRLSFFAPWSTYSHKQVAAMAGWVQSSVRGDTVATIFAPSDTIYLMLTDGTMLQRIPIPKARFRAPGPLPGGAESNLRALLDWQSRYDFVADVIWSGNGLLVPYQTYQEGRPLFSLLAFRRNGQVVFNLSPAPRLLAADSAGESLLFEDRDTTLGGHWATARLTISLEQ